MPLPPDPIYDTTAQFVGDDANYSVSGDAYDGKPVKVTPALGVIKQLFRPKRQFPSQYVNWVMNQLGLVTRRLREDITPLLFPLADLAALVAITGPFDGMMRWVKGFGYYVFDAADTTTPVSSPYVLVPTDATPGRWLSGTNLLHNKAKGLAGLDASQRIEILAATNPVFAAGPRNISHVIPLHGFLVAVDPTDLGIHDVTADKNADFFSNYTLYPAPGNPAPLEPWHYAFGVLQINQTGATTGKTQGVMIDITPFLIDGSTLSSVGFLVSPDPTHVNPPQYRPLIGVFRSNGSSGWESLSSISDFKADAVGLSTYNTPHTASQTCDQNNVIDKASYSYCVQFWNEAGIDAISGLQLKRIVANMTNIAELRYA